MIGALDMLTGTEISFSIFYLIPIAIVALYTDIKRSIIILNSFIAAVTWFIAELSSNLTYSSFLIPYWNALMRMFIFILVGFLLYSLKEKQKRLQWKNSELEDLNKQILLQKSEIETVNDLLQIESDKSDILLHNILPDKIIQQLKDRNGTATNYYESCTVMFTDFKDFVKIAEALTPEDLVRELNFCFSAFDDIIQSYEIEKIKTMGDSYMCVGGVPEKNKSNAIDIVLAAMEIIRFINNYNETRKENNLPTFEIRIGINTGHLIAGVVGKSKFAYDVWGDTVNVASRLEKSSVPGKINISEETYHHISEFIICQQRGKISVKNKSDIDMYFVESIKTGFSELDNPAIPNIDLLSRTSFKNIESNEAENNSLKVFDRIISQ